MRAAVLIVVSGCAYKAGSFSHPQQGFLGERVTVGCLDLSVERRGDMPDGARVLEYYFGNRCDRPQLVDLRHARLYGRTWDGRDVSLHPYDPRAEIRPMKLDGRAVGHEAIAYHTDEPLAQVCVDARSVAGDTTQSQWLCFASDLPTDTVAEVAP